MTVLDSVPDIELLEYLPEFLDGLFKMLSDNEQVGWLPSPPRCWPLQARPASLIRTQRVCVCVVSTTGHSHASRQRVGRVPQRDPLGSSRRVRQDGRDSHSFCHFPRYSPPELVVVVVGTNLSGGGGVTTDEFTQLTALKWVNEFILCGKEELLPYAADLVGAILPSISHRVQDIQQQASSANTSLLRLISGYTSLQPRPTSRSKTSL